VDNWVSYVCLGVFLLGYVGITLEHVIKKSKTAIALATGGLLWWITAVFGQVDHLAEKIFHAGSEIFGVVAFLFAAMALVEILNRYHFFDFIRAQIYKLGLGDKGQLMTILVIAAVLSAVIDNLTTTIVMIQIASRFFKGKNLLIAGAGIVSAANIGGASSPIGDVTTLMIWLAGNASATTIISRGILPCLAMLGVTLVFMCRGIRGDTRDEKDEIVPKLTREEKIVIGLAFGSFGLPLGATLFGLPPYIGLLTGLGVVWLVIQLLGHIDGAPTHLDTSIDDLLKSTDSSSRLFFIGILLAVAALQALGILSWMSGLLYGDGTSTLRVVFGNVGLGMASALVDNIPLTAGALVMLTTTDQSLWVLLALTVGTGGSLLVIGSAAGVVAMGMIKELTFFTYVKIAFLPVLAAYATGIGVWCFQYFVLGW